MENLLSLLLSPRLDLLACAVKVFEAGVLSYQVVSVFGDFHPESEAVLNRYLYYSPRPSADTNTK